MIQKSRYIKKIFIYIVLIVIFIFWLLEGRTFYYLNDNKCVTVWKTLNNICYIIPYKYYGLKVPSDCYIKTKNSDKITIYWVDTVKNYIIIRSDAEIGDTSNKCEVFNNNSKINIEKFCINGEVDTLIVKKLYGKLKSPIYNTLNGVEYINIDILENVATDKTRNYCSKSLSF